MQIENAQRDMAKQIVKFLFIELSSLFLQELLLLFKFKILTTQATNPICTQRKTPGKFALIFPSRIFYQRGS